MPYEINYHPKVRKVLASLDGKQEEDGNDEEGEDLVAGRDVHVIDHRRRL